ncbi:hypothetical protein [Roseospira navarrensis]|uniref:Uncharacterized protein n=1 Tax=Roseospira navarrensis TaxID=140058 RepID=A0A7X1ZEC3_9PROT|nr:hypothetical protein [Roseospira navarrensis]MQX37003.1 hypothetical protein [Roseospira navarrensis]
MLNYMTLSGRRSRGSFVRLMIVLTVLFFGFFITLGFVFLPFPEGISQAEKAERAYPFESGTTSCGDRWPETA